MAGANDRDTLIAWPRFHQPTQQPTELDESLRLRQRRSKNVCVHRHDWEICLWPQRNDRTGNAVVDAELVAECEVESSVKTLAQQIRRQLFVAFEAHPG